MLFNYLVKSVRIKLLIKDIKVFHIKLIWLDNVQVFFLIIKPLNGLRNHIELVKVNMAFNVNYVPYDFNIIKTSSHMEALKSNK